MTRVAALHDAGKVALPDYIPKSTLENQQLADIFFSSCVTNRTGQRRL